LLTQLSVVASSSGILITQQVLLEEMAKNQTGKSDIECQFYESASDVLGPNELSSDKKNLMVYNDLLLERQKQMQGLLHQR